MCALDFVTLTWHNMKKNILNLSVKILFFVFILFPAFYLFGESFVVAKQSKKAPSHSKLKEQCCEECASILELTPELLRAVADVHQTALSNLRCYIDGGDTGFIATQSKAQMTACHQKLQALNTKMESLAQEIKECQVFLETGYLKASAKPK